MIGATSAAGETVEMFAGSEKAKGGSTTWPRGGGGEEGATAAHPRRQLRLPQLAPRQEFDVWIGNVNPLFVDLLMLD